MNGVEDIPFNRKPFVECPTRIEDAIAVAADRHYLAPAYM